MYMRACTCACIPYKRIRILHIGCTYTLTEAYGWLTDDILGDLGDHFLSEPDHVVIVSVCLHGTSVLQSRCVVLSADFHTNKC
jgi:hypothetical protein